VPAGSAPRGVPAADLDTAGVVTAYKNLANVERDFRTLKTGDPDLRPSTTHHRLEDRVRGHVLICMLAAYLVWHECVLLVRGRN
jgi:transposase